jgi:hypothetical protein
LNSIDVSRAIAATLDAGGREALLRGALIYEYRPQITQVVEYGSADAVLSGQARPGEGERFDFNLKGPVSGATLQGTFRGVDYIYFRADGRAERRVHGEITTEDGKRIEDRTGSGWCRDSGGGLSGLPAPRACFPDDQPPELSLGKTRSSSGRGLVDVSTGHVHAKAYGV